MRGRKGVRDRAASARVWLWGLEREGTLCATAAGMSSAAEALLAAPDSALMMIHGRMMEEKVWRRV